jgi:hypothetical protein
MRVGNGGIEGVQWNLPTVETVMALAEAQHMGQKQKANFMVRIGEYCVAIHSPRPSSLRIPPLDRRGSIFSPAPLCWRGPIVAARPDIYYNKIIVYLYSC